MNGTMRNKVGPTGWNLKDCCNVFKGAGRTGVGELTFVFESLSKGHDLGGRLSKDGDNAI